MTAGEILERFGLRELNRPEDGIIYLFKDSVDGFWRISYDEDFAMELATGYPLGELIELEKHGDYSYQEEGDIRAIYVGEDFSIPDGENAECPGCGRVGEENVNIVYSNVCICPHEDCGVRQYYTSEDNTPKYY